MQSNTKASITKLLLHKKSIANRWLEKLREVKGTENKLIEKFRRKKIYISKGKIYSFEAL